MTRKLGDIPTFHAFKNRNYRLFFAGQATSQMGSWIQRTAISWVVFSETNSTIMLGVAAFAGQFPSFLLSLFGGIVADRFERRKILLITQSASLLQAIVLAAIVLTDHFTIWALLGLNVFLGIVNAFDVPARQPLVHELVDDKEDLPNALALNSAMINFARLGGPAIAGIILHWLGAGLCFLINAVTFLAVLGSLIAMKLPAFVPRERTTSAIQELSEGFNYVRHHPSISRLLIMLTIVSLFIFPYDTLIPVFAKDIFHGNATTFGMISSFMGIGAIIGTFFLASLKKGADMKLTLLINTCVMGTGLLLFSQTTWFPLALVFAVISGFGAMTQNTIFITILQVSAEASMRGRVMSFLALSFFGMLPLGSLLIGTISSQLGAPLTMTLQGIAALAIALIFSNFLRQDYLTRREQRKLAETENQILENY